VIRSFACRDTQAVFEGRSCRRFANIRTVLERKLAWLDAAVNLGALRAPPANRLEPLVGDRVGQHSIRVNDQFRLCFTWTAHGPENVECVDYH
jgi:proteic killer suppression protein